MSLSNSYKQFAEDTPPSGGAPAVNNGSKSATAAALAAVATLVSSGIAAYSQHRTNQSNREMQQEAYRANLLQWQRENAYNTPLNMRRRLEMAGFNAGLMYQNGGGTAASAPSPQMESSENSPVFSGLGGMQGIAGSFLENRLLEERIRGQKIANDQAEENKPIEHEIKIQTLEKIKADLRQSIFDYNKSLDDSYRSRVLYEKQLEEIEEKIKNQQTTNDILDEQLKWERDTYDSRKLELDLKNTFQSLNIKLSERELEETQKTIEAIELNNYTLAQKEYFTNNCYPILKRIVEEEYKKSANTPYQVGTKIGGLIKARGELLRALRKGTPDDLWHELTTQERETLLNAAAKRNGYNSFYHVYTSDKQYQNLYYKSLNQQNLTEPVRKFYDNLESPQQVIQVKNRKSY